jgi:hypothetical protein
MRANAPCITLLKKLQLIKSLLQLILAQGQSSVRIDKNIPNTIDFEENYYQPINKLHVLIWCFSRQKTLLTIYKKDGLCFMGQ